MEKVNCSLIRYSEYANAKVSKHRIIIISDMKQQHVTKSTYLHK